MGAYLTVPITQTYPEDGNGNRLIYGASSMQGWRASQEDAHNCELEFDKNTSLFAVYDGHGGAEIAMYLSKRFPDLLKAIEAYKAGNYKEALCEAYLKIDESIKTPEVMAEIIRYSKLGKNCDKPHEDVEEDMKELYEEATMPIEQLVEKYRQAVANKSTPNESKDCKEDKPGTSHPSSSPSCSSSRIKKPENACSSSSSGLSAEGSSSEAQCSSSSKDESKTVEKDKEVVKHKEELTSTTTVEKTEQIKEETKEDIPKENGIEIKDKEEIEGSTCTVKTNGAEDDAKDREVIINGNGTIDGDREATTTEADSMSNGIPREESILVEPAKPRKKIHPIPVIPVPEEAKKTRTSPRKDAKLYKNFVNDEDDDSGSSDSEDLKPEIDSSDSEMEEDESESDEDGEDEEEEEDENAQMGDEDEEDDMEDILNDIQEPGFDSGATAVMALAKWDEDRLLLWVANAGDSRCVVCRGGEALEMSHDHKPEDESETLRIVTAGGKVTSEGRVNGGLNLSRAIGDHSYKQNSSLPFKEQMITSFPDIEYAELDPKNDKFIVLACDGIWNSMSSQQVVEFVAARIDDPNKTLSGICDELFYACLSTDTMGDGTGCDNMTAIIIKIDGLKPPMEPESTNEMKPTSVEVGSKRSASPTPMSPDNKRIKVDSESDLPAAEVPEKPTVSTTSTD